MAKKTSNAVRPVDQVRIGSVKAAIWRNEGENGPRFNVTFERLYRTEQGDWRSTDSFGHADLLILAKLADAAHTRVLRLIAESRPQAQSAGAA